MIHIVIDTNILERPYNLSSSKFSAVRELCECKNVQLHIPITVQQEFLGYRKGLIEEGLRQMKQGLKLIMQQAVMDQSPLSVCCAELQETFAELDRRCATIISDEFTQWGQALHAQFHPIAPHHGNNVLNAYFNAELPFKHPQIVSKGKRQVVQRRKDEFPDAFIWQTVLDLAEAHQEIHFISNNTSDFRQACENTPQVTLYSSLEEFLMSPQVNSYRLEHFTEQQFEAILEVLQQEETSFMPKLTHAVFEEFTLWDDMILENLISDSGVEISGWYLPAVDKWLTKIDYAKARYFGYGIIELPLSVTIEEFHVSYYKTIYELPQPLPPNTEIRSAFTPGEPALFDTEDYFPLTLHISIELQFPSDMTIPLTRESIPEMLEHVIVDIDQIDDATADETRRKRFYMIT
jgi:hypothetical protein